MTLLLVYKALHIGFMVAWFAGIFYLPRLFVYHADSKSADVDALFKIMERRLLYFVTPFAVLTLLFGLLLIHSYGGAWFKASQW
ncbi:MAG: CopD family protein, partial [Rheinheimera sp.]